LGVDIEMYEGLGWVFWVGLAHCETHDPGKSRGIILHLIIVAP
jgi:hypothetical protein